jgi:hypothetical protein
MELAGSNYLYTLALVSISYVGFTALILIFRQSAGGQLTILDGFIIRVFIHLGFLAVLGSLLPSLLALFGIQPATIWQISSGIIAIILGVWVVSFPSRRHAASPIPIPQPIWAALVFLSVVDLVLLSNVIRPPGEIGNAIYALDVTGILLGGVMLFLFSLILFFGPRPIDRIEEREQPGKGRTRARRRGR